MADNFQKTIAVDCALLLPVPAEERVRSLNALLYAEQPDGFEIDATHLAHISLAQMFVRRSDLLPLIEKFHSILSEQHPLPMRVSLVATRDSTVSLLLDRSLELARLHARLLDSCKTLETTGDRDSFYGIDEQAPDRDRERPRERDVQWVSHFREASAYTKFVPHITLGLGTAPAPNISLEFTVNRAGLFHLGRFCTCRAVLHEWHW